MRFKVIPIPREITAEVRESLVSPQYKSFAATVTVANGYGPCRSCLRVFDQGNERRIGFVYNPFEGISGLPDPGPVFIHERACEPFDGNAFPADLLALPIYMEAFGDEISLIERRRLEPDRPEPDTAGLFADSRVRFVNLRNAEAGCFIARIERS